MITDITKHYSRAESASLSFLVTHNNAVLTYSYAALTRPGHWPERAAAF